MKKLIILLLIGITLNAVFGEELFFDDFEAGLVNWNVTDEFGGGVVWSIESDPFPNGYTMPPTSTGNLCVADADEYGSGTSTDTILELITPLNLAIYDDIILSFDSDFNAIDAEDYCYVDISTDGTNWQNVFTLGGDTTDYPAVQEEIDITEIASLESSVYIRFHSVQPGWDWWWAIDNVAVNAEVAVALTAPAAPASVVVTPDPTGTLSTDISWICPTIDVEGNTLTELTEMVVYRNDELIYTDSAPVIGSAGNYADTVPDNGFYTYNIHGVNTSGNGVPVLTTVFVGEDVPASVTNLHLEQSAPGALSGTLTWTNPIIGLNGGVLNEISGFNIERSDGTIFDLQGEFTQYVDDTIPMSGNYFYTVQPYNSLGEGNIAISNSVLVADAGLLVMEGFEGGILPGSWSEEIVVGTTEWIYENGGQAGNPANAHTGSFNARFYNSAGDTSKLITPELNLGNANPGELTFWHTQAVWAGDQDELKVYYKTSAAGAWELLEYYTESITEWTERIITLPNPSTTYYVAFEGIGQYGYGVCIDDVLITGNPIVYDNDLASMSVSGPEIVSIGNSEVYDVVVRNVGEVAQTGYTVKLMREGNVELASADIDQTLAPFAEATHSLVWNISNDETPGYTNLYGTVILTGDENPANDPSNMLEVRIMEAGAYEVTVGDGTLQDNRVPMSFNYNNSLTQTMYYPEEIGQLGVIQSVTYYTNFTENIGSKPTKLWMCETDSTNFTFGWTPYDSFVQVFDGNVNYPIGENAVTITLEEPYLYEGGNLVIMAQRPWDDNAYPTTEYFLTDTTPEHLDRIIYNRDNTEEYDPMNPPDVFFADDEFPNTTIYMILGGLGSIEGYVYDDNNDPLQGALVERAGSTSFTYTDDGGFYQFANVPSGDQEFTASLFGYSPQTQSIEIVENETAELDFDLIPLSEVSVTGTIAGSDFPEDGLQGAIVSLTGFADYQTITNATGGFTFPAVYTNITYDISVSYEGYESYVGEVVVEGVDVDLGPIILTEIAAPPNNLQATQNDAQTEVELLWYSPGSGFGEFRYDDGEYSDNIGLGDTPTDAVFGCVHHHNAILNEVTWYLSSENGIHNQVKIYIFGLDGNGAPNQSDVLFSSGYVPNTDDEWSSLILPVPVETPNGFLVGVSTPGEFTSIGYDDGIEEPWPFVDATQMLISDYTDTEEEWIDLGEYPFFENNLMIRAMGIDLGEIETRADFAQDTVSSKPANTREFESYNVYRFDEDDHYNQDNWDLVGSAVADTFFTDTSWAGLDEGFYQFAVKSVHTNNVESAPAFSAIVEKTTLADSPADLIPMVTALNGNYPNPFNPETNISYQLSESSNVNLSIYNVKGQKIRSLINGIEEAGHKNIIWTGKDDSGKDVSSGVYFYKLKTTKYNKIKKMILMK